MVRGPRLVRPINVVRPDVLPTVRVGLRVKVGTEEPQVLQPVTVAVDVIELLGHLVDLDAVELDVTLAVRAAPPCTLVEASGSGVARGDPQDGRGEPLRLECSGPRIEERSPDAACHARTWRPPIASASSTTASRTLTGTSSAHEELDERRQDLPGLPAEDRVGLRVVGRRLGVDDHQPGPGCECYSGE